MSSRVARSRLVVLYIDSLKLGGAERITLTWASWLRDAGWSPVVLTRKPLSWDFYPVPDGVAREVEPTDPPWLRCLGVAGWCPSDIIFGSAEVAFDLSALARLLLLVGIIVGGMMPLLVTALLLD